MKQSHSEWTTIPDARAVLLKKWEKGIFLREKVEPQGIFPFRIPLSMPSPSDLSERFASARTWALEIKASLKSGLFDLDWKKTNNRIIGQNKIPSGLVFPDLSSIAKFVGKTKELASFGKIAEYLLTEFPELSNWLLKHALKAVDLEPVIEKLLSVIRWIKEHPRPGIYLRQLSLKNIDTKFIEAHKKTIGDWLDLLLAPSCIDSRFTGAKGFEERFGFLVKPALLRFRILDQSVSKAGFRDLTVRADEFCRMPQAGRIVFVTENDINGLAFPQIKSSIVIFGKGYGFDSLSNATWLKHREIHYWGDIDTHGFAILSQFRKHFPHAGSFLMNKETLLACRESWSTEKQHPVIPPNLTEEERALYLDLREHRFGASVRLEQELIPFELVMRAISDSQFGQFSR